MPMSIEQLKEEWHKDCIISQNDIGYESLKTASLHAKYLDELFYYRNKVLAIEKQYNAMRKLRTRYYRGELTHAELVDNNWPQYNGPKLAKTETDTFLSGDEELVAMKYNLDLVKNIVTYIESIMKQISTRTYDIKNFLLDRQFTTGY